MIKIIQFSDSHLFGDKEKRICGLDTFSTFKDVVKLAKKTNWPPDLILLTGDNSQDATEESYRRLSQVFSKSPAPVYCLPGNHDATPVMKSVLGKAKIKTDKTFSFGGWNFIFLDSNVPASPKGFLKNEELQFLSKALDEADDGPTLIGVHHQPYPVGSKWIDTMAVGNSKELWEILSSHENVKCVLFGHVHQEFDDFQSEIRVLGAPSTCFQFEPKKKNFALDAEPPGFRWLLLSSDGKIETGIKRLSQIPSELDLTTPGY